MPSELTLLDLRTQASAVRRRLLGLSLSEKLDWLAARGRVALVRTRSGPAVYEFTAASGLYCAFYFDNDDLVLFGDHSTIVIRDNE